MYTIGLTGNFGTGKTTVSRILAALGVAVISTDEIGHRVLASDKEIHSKLVAAFGDEILDEKGNIDRRKLGKVAFCTPEGTETLNNILHAVLKDKIIESVENYGKEGIDILVLESALIPREEWSPVINEFWVTNSPQEVVIERMKKQRGYSQSEVLDRIKRQIPPAEMLKQADVIINTDCSIDDLQEQVRALWKSLKKRIREKDSSV